MKQMLIPKDGKTFLTPIEAAYRLMKHFEFCQMDDLDEGPYQLGDSLKGMIDTNTGFDLIDEVFYGQAKRISVTIADKSNKDAYLNFVLREKKGIQIKYYSVEHQTSAQPLLLQCASILDYQIKEID